MITRRAAARRVKVEIKNLGVPPHVNQVPPQEYGTLCDQASCLVNPEIMSDGEIMEDFLNFTHIIYTKAQAITSQAQGMTTHEIGKLHLVSIKMLVA